MAEITADRVLETSITTGTGSYTLAGAVTGFRSFASVAPNGSTVRCYVEEVDANGVPNGGWEVGIYTWGTGGILARTTVQASSNSNAAVNWSAGTRRIGLGVTAAKLATFVTSAGLTNFAEAVSSASPNNTVRTVSLAAVGSTSDVDMALVPKGAGGVALAVADNSAANGNKRGTQAVDLQLYRSAATQIAAGVWSTLLGGANNTANGNYAGQVGGSDNKVNNDYAFGGGGANNTASGIQAATIGGTLNTASGTGAVAMGGFNNVADADNSVVMGIYATVRGMMGAIARASGNLLSSLGQRQARDAVLCCNTTSATPTALTTNGGNPGPTNQFGLPVASVLRIKGQIVVRNATTDKGGSWDISAVLSNSAAGTVALQGSVTVSAYQGDASLSGCTVSIVADNTNQAAQVRATGIASTTLSWSGEFTTCEVGV